jgi:hypothetical protein
LRSDTAGVNRAGGPSSSVVFVERMSPSWVAKSAKSALFGGGRRRRCRSRHQPLRLQLNETSRLARQSASNCSSSSSCPHVGVQLRETGYRTGVLVARQLLQGRHRFSGVGRLLAHDHAAHAESQQPLRGGRAGEKMVWVRPPTPSLPLAFEAAAESGAGAPLEGSRTVATSMRVRSCSSHRTPRAGPRSEPTRRSPTPGSDPRPAHAAPSGHRGAPHLGDHGMGVQLRVGGPRVVVVIGGHGPPGPASALLGVAALDRDGAFVGARVGVQMLGLGGGSSTALSALWRKHGRPTGSWVTGSWPSPSRRRRCSSVTAPPRSTRRWLVPRPSRRSGALR